MGESDGRGDEEVSEPVREYRLTITRNLLNPEYKPNAFSYGVDEKNRQYLESCELQVTVTQVEFDAIRKALLAAMP